jgi:ABC-2 type transport system permease protein
LGSIPLLFAYGAVYLLVMLGIGLLISTLADSQQQAMFMSWFFMVVFILLSGLFTAIENMPHWVQIITYFDPIRYFIEVLRMVLLKGAKFADVRNHFIITAIFAVVVNTFAVIRYRKVS